MDSDTRRSRKRRRIMSDEDDQVSQKAACVSNPGTPLTIRPQMLQSFVEREDIIRSIITCKVCFRMLYEPYTLGCGHTYCYSCLCQWFDSAQGRSKTCPDCRARVQAQPAPAFALKEIVKEFIKRQELLSENETVAEHKNLEEEEAAFVESDRNRTGTDDAGLFRGRFNADMVRASRFPILDQQDNVRRCPLCAWELVSGDEGLECEQCGWQDPDDAYPQNLEVILGLAGHGASSRGENADVDLSYGSSDPGEGILSTDDEGDYSGESSDGGSSMDDFVVNDEDTTVYENDGASQSSSVSTPRQSQTVRRAGWRRHIIDDSDGDPENDDDESGSDEEIQNGYSESNSSDNSVSGIEHPQIRTTAYVDLTTDDSDEAKSEENATSDNATESSSDEEEDSSVQARSTRRTAAGSTRRMLNAQYTSQPKLPSRGRRRLPSPSTDSDDSY